MTAEPQDQWPLSDTGLRDVKRRSVFTTFPQIELLIEIALIAALRAKNRQKRRLMEVLDRLEGLLKKAGKIIG